jgi:hypothetical protein
MTTANDQINGAMRLLGVLAEGETPSAATSQDALAALNQMIDSWNTERLSVFSTQDQVKTWLPNSISNTLGPTGTLVGTRPILIDDASELDSMPEGVDTPYRDILDRIKYEDERTDYSAKTLTADQRTEMALFHSFK